jgi:DNA-binding PadR family transcriptional regulator
MSPVFRHGGLRLYLLKLLDEEPRHGYDVIRLLQDRFLGVYSPSPGTIYPRLARLEEEGLVTHEVVDGKKVYKITDAGREELNRRLDDLADLEDELSASVRDIAKEISRDVRETVRTIRDELTWAVREASRGPRGRDRASSSASASASHSADDAESASSPAGSADQAATGPTSAPTDQAPRDHDDWKAWADWACRRDWREWADWGWARGDWPWAKEDWREAKEQAKADWREAKEEAKADWRKGKEQAKADWREPQDQAKADRGRARAEHADHAHRMAHGDVAADLERLAAAFAREVRGVARHAEAVSEDAGASLVGILGEALNRIRNEVFRSEPAEPTARTETDETPGEATKPAARTETDETPSGPTEPSARTETDETPGGPTEPSAGMEPDKPTGPATSTS